MSAIFHKSDVTSALAPCARAAIATDPKISRISHPKTVNPRGDTYRLNSCIPEGPDSSTPNTEHPAPASHRLVEQDADHLVFLEDRQRLLEGGALRDAGADHQQHAVGER